jgi:membrane protease YdiL (CAAX protease family)
VKGVMGILALQTVLRLDMSAHIHQLLAFGLAVALLGAPVLLLTVKLVGGNPLGLPVRLALWVLAGIACEIAVLANEPWSQLLGLRVPSWQTFVGAAAATCAVLAAWPFLQYIQREAGGISVTQNLVFQKIVALPLTYRLFLVATAAVTEEILYRGFAIGIGKGFLGNTLEAATISVVIFTVTHYGWGLSHMLSVLWAALAFTSLYIVTGDLLACIVAHGAIDAIGLVIAPAAMARRRSAKGDARKSV